MLGAVQGDKQERGRRGRALDGSELSLIRVPPVFVLTQ